MNAINSKAPTPEGSKLGNWPDRRQTPRRRVLKQAKAVFNGFRSVIDCTIRDLSTGGARIACDQVIALPDWFHLVMMPERDMREVRVVWRRPGEAGLQFVSGPIKAMRLQI
jgi:hypothetical protein